MSIIDTFNAVDSAFCHRKSYNYKYYWQAKKNKTKQIIFATSAYKMKSD